MKCGGVLTNNCAKRKEKETNEQTKVRKEKEKKKKNGKKKKKKKKKKRIEKKEEKKSRVIKFCNCSFVIFLNNCGDWDDVTMFYYIL